MSYFETWKKAGRFDERSTRSEYWFFVSVNYVLLMIVAALDYSKTTSTQTTSIILFAFLIVTFVPTLAVTIRRLRDAGKSSGHVFWFFLPGIGAPILFALCLLPSERGRNRFGDNPFGQF